MEERVFETLAETLFETNIETLFKSERRSETLVPEESLGPSRSYTFGVPSSFSARVFGAPKKCGLIFAYLLPDIFSKFQGET